MPPDSALRFVDPLAHRGPLYRMFARFSATRVGRWLSRHFLWKVDPWLLRMTNGRLSSGLIIRTGLLETRGARTGTVRRKAVIYFNDGDRVTIIASKAGAAENSSWYHNARANPEVTFGGQPFRAVLIDDESERIRLWAFADRVFPPYADFRERAAHAGRTIPVLQLVPR